MKHLSECKLLLSHTPLHGLCLPDARDYRRCNLPASHGGLPHQVFPVIFVSQTLGITGDANLPASDSSDCSEKRPKLSSPEGIRTRVRRAESRDLTIYATGTRYLIFMAASFFILLFPCGKHKLNLDLLVVFEMGGHKL